jgi:hypothetical protein
LAAVIVALKEYGEKLPENITERVLPFFKSSRWSAAPLLLIGVFVLLLFLQFLGVLPKDRGEIPPSSSSASDSAPTPQSDENARQIVKLRSDLESREKDLAIEREARIAAEQRASSSQAALASLQEAANALPYNQKVGLPDITIAFNLIWPVEDIVKQLQGNDDSILITTAPQNADLGKYLTDLIEMTATALWIKNNTVRRGLVVQLPNYQNDLDAPRFDTSNYPGISIHGEPKYITDGAPFRGTITDLFGRMRLICNAKIGWTQKSVSQLSQYYKRNVIWIEIGSEALPKHRC